MSTYPKISAFVLTYNQKEFVRDAIESILIQKYPNLEIVVGDDGSTDGTQEILLEYRNKNPGLFKLLLSDMNEGITANCNKILRACTGEYVAFLAGDDIWLPGKLFKQLSLLEETPGASLCVSKVEVFDSSTNKIISVSPSGDFNVENMSIIEIVYYLGNTASAMMVRRKAVPEYGFEPSISMVSDWLFFIEVLRKGSIAFINEALVRYRRHDKNTSANSNLIFKEHIQTLFLLENKYEDMKEDVSKFRDKSIATDAIVILDKTKNFELKRKLIEASLNACPTAMLIKSIFIILINRALLKFKSVLNKLYSGMAK